MFTFSLGDYKLFFLSLVICAYTFLIKRRSSKKKKRRRNNKWEMRKTEDKK